jgi:outer membrane lipoprotein-sorting protein
LKKSTIPSILLTLFICLTAAARVLPASSLSGEDILKKVDVSLAPYSSEVYKKLINIEPDGSKKEFVMYTVKKGNDKLAMLFVSPESEKGRATLRLGDNMWMYIPNVTKPIRITSMQSVVGGVFNNSDIMHLDYTVEYKVANMEDNETEYILDLKAKTNAVAYDHLKMWVEKKDITPTKLECYTASGMLIKTLHFKEKKDIGDGVLRPSVIETDSPMFKGYRSIFVFAKLKKRDFKDEVFTLNFLPRLGDLR